MKTVKNIIIGFGKAGKTLAQDFNIREEKTILVEKDPKMYGGTCINVACIPSKKLAELAKNKPSDVEKTKYYKQSIQEKKELISALNEKNYENVQKNEYVEVIDGMATFISDKQVKISLSEGGEEYYEAERIFINTGSKPNIPPIDGLEIDGEKIHTSETLMDDEEFPENLTIIGDGNIGLEFASIYSQFGSNVTLISKHSKADFLEKEDQDVAEAVLEALQNLGVQFIFEAETTKVEKYNEELVLTYKNGRSVNSIQTDKLLVAVGRTANIEGLNIEAAGVYIAEDDSIQVNKHLQTNIKHIFAMGDVNGGPQHTYLSLDDYRMVLSVLYADGSYNLSERNNVPEVTFIHPPLSSVGLTEREAKREGYNIKVSKLEVSNIPQAKILNDDVGIYKAVIDADTDEILGTTLFAEDSHEVINILTLAIKNKLSYSDLANQIFAHPTMAEALNDLFKAFNE